MPKAAAPSPDWATGGSRNAYRHVDCLNAAGIPAAVVHDRPGHRYTWFVHDTRVVDVRGVVRTPHSVLVVAEGFGPGDGFGLPPAEAMASGCFLVGYPGGGGREYFDAPYCAPVPDADLLAFAWAVEQACANYEADPDTFAKAGRLASETILGHYIASGLRDDLVAFYGPLVGA